MSLDFTLVLRAETAAAKAELEAAARGVQGVSAATERATAATTRSAAADRAAATAKQANARAATQMATANRQAAGATGNLVANLNDIGMMLAAGQNPLQLAIQQGTQITQVIGPMGAAGAVQALGASLAAMLSPINLITLGVITASGVMIQWLTSSSSEADAVAAALDRQKAALEGIVAETEKLRLERGMLLSGAETENEQVILERNIQLLAERAAIDERLAAQSAAIGNARGAAALAELEARRAAINVEIGANNEKLRGLEVERQKNAETAAAVDLAGQVRSATVGIASALQAADGSRLNAAFAGAFPLASQLLGMAQGIVATIGQAQAFQSAETGELAAQYAQYGAGRTIGERLARESGSLYGGRSVLPAVRTPGGGGGGAAAARDEADALQELITGLEGEIEALRVTNPIMAEMLQHREALAGATEAERQRVEELIATRDREAAAIEAAKSRAEFFENTGAQAIEALIVKGESFNEVLKQIASSLIQAAIQAAIFGEGPFGDFFGGTSIFSGLFGPGKAAGGMVYGPGTGTSDSILTPLSNGEFVVNARATARNRQLLEAINAGGRMGPGRAEGGMVGSGSAGRSGVAGRDLPGSIYIDLRGAQGDREIEEKVRRGAAQVVSLYDREGLAVGVQRVSRDPKRRG